MKYAIVTSAGTVQDYVTMAGVFRPRLVHLPRIPVRTVGAWPYDRSMSKSAQWDGIITADRSPKTGEYDFVTPATVAKIKNWPEVTVGAPRVRRPRAIS